MSAQAPRPVVLLVTCSLLPDGEEYAGTIAPPGGLRAARHRRPLGGVGRPERRLVRRTRRRPLDLGLRDASRGVPRLGAHGAPDAQLRRACSPGTPTSPTCPSSPATGVPVVPTIVVENEAELPTAIAEVSAASDRPNAVVKPTVGAGGRGVVVFDGSEEDFVRARTSRPSAQVRGRCSRWSTRCAPRARPRCSSSTARSSRRRRSVPAAGEIRVHEQYGGTTVAVPLTDEAADLARRTVEAASALLGERPRLRPGRPDAPGRRHPGRQRARGHRARALPRGAARQRGRLRRPGGRTFDRP